MKVFGFVVLLSTLSSAVADNLVATMIRHLTDFFRVLNNSQDVRRIQDTVEQSTSGKSTGGGGGDPHFRTHDGTNYEYHGQCDLVMARSSSFGAGLGLDVHARTFVIHNWSLFSNFAIRIGNDIFEVKNDGTHYFNGVPNREFPLQLAGQYNIIKTLERVFIAGDAPDAAPNLKTWYNIDMGSGQSIKITNWKTMLSITFDVVLQDTFGMLGTTGKVGLIGRDGSSVIKEVDEMGQEWQVTDKEPMLFRSIQSPQYPEKCMLPKVEARRVLRQSDNIVRRAKEACGGISDELMRKFCVQDVSMTSDLDLAAGYTF